MTRPAPWEAVSPQHQSFVLITGANSGVGLALGERLMDEFLATRPRASHLVLLPTARSPLKCAAVVRSLRLYASRCHGAAAASRVHVLSLPLDLCDLAGVQAFAARICGSRVSNPPGLEGDDALVDVVVPRLDAIVFNAGYGGWTGVSWAALLRNVLRDGPSSTFTWPSFLAELPPPVLNERSALGYPGKPLLGEVFVSCLFGHYLLAHGLMPLLVRKGGDSAPPGRIVWCSSLSSSKTAYSPEDPQCLAGPGGYDSVKRLIDIMCLSAELPAVRPLARRFLQPDAPDREKDREEDRDKDEEKDQDRVPPRMYLSHPGIVVTPLVPLSAFVLLCYKISVLIMRWLGSPWHCYHVYVAAKAACWLVLSGQDELDAANAHRIKWGSARSADNEAFVKPTEVQDWGWEGRPETDESIRADTAPGSLHKMCGRKPHMPPITSEDLESFEEQGVEVWSELERMRCQWADILRSRHLD